MRVSRLLQAARQFPARIGDRREEYAALAAGQRPAMLFISCSDSRVIPSAITGAGPGELFELRVVGAIVPQYSPTSRCGVAATIEYAVDDLGIRHIVVCGHSHCGAVTALVTGRERPDSLVGRWLDQPHLPRDAAADDHPALPGAVQQHVVAQLTALRTYPQIQSRAEAGVLELHGWYYEVHTGAVSAHEPVTGAFRPL